MSYCRSGTAGEITAPSIEGLDESDRAFAIGNRLDGRYLLKSLLGSGGLGKVFLCDDERLDREVAIKVLHHNRAMNADAIMNLETEARIGAGLQHPHIAAVYDFGFSENRSYTVFEFVDGETLRSILRRRTQVQTDEVRAIADQLSRALDHAHSKGIVHRDLKPENVCLAKSGIFKVLDLGFARDINQEVEAGLYSGTPAYSSPEQASCQPIDGRSDQYSLAVMCYEMLSGQRPFRAGTPAEMLLHQIRTPTPNLRDKLPSLPDAMATAIMRALAKSSEDRFTTCQEFAAAMSAETAAGALQTIGVSESDRYSFYVCHCPEDSVVARSLADGLERNRFPCWVFGRDALPGVPLREQVRSAMRQSHGLLLLISRSFLHASDLIDELSHAHQMDRVLFPILLDMSQEEFDSHQLVWRPILGPGVLTLTGRNQVDEMVRRIAAGAEATGINRSPIKIPSRSTSLAHLAGRRWATDANQIDIHDLDRIVFRTETINDFLTADNKTFLSATKGLGKTLLLTYKRHVMTSRDRSRQAVTMIPEGRPYLDFMSELRSLSERYHKPLASLNTTKRLWNAALRIAVLSHHGGLIRDDEAFELAAFPRRIRHWLGGVQIQPTVAFKELLGVPVSELNRIIDETENFLDQKMRSLHSGTYLFVDKVDQAIRQLPRSAWINVQAGLIEAAWEMMNANSHLRVFATIREEAFANYESDVKSNLLGATTRLQYSEVELAEMMNQLASCYEGRLDVRDFVGFNVVRHPQRPDPEDSYQFLRRHSFGRPRDLVAMASSISSKGKSLSEDQFRSAVYETSATSLVPNVFDESHAFLNCLSDRDNRQRFLGMLPNNLLSRSEAVAVCERFNGLESGSFQHFGEQSSDLYHPFHDLYLSGLLGVLEKDSESGETKQRFRQPHDLLHDLDFELPSSDYYAIHPALNSFIIGRRRNAAYTIFQHIQIGHGQRWEGYYAIFREIETQLGADLGVDQLAAGRKLLRQAHTQLKSQSDRRHLSLAQRDWETLEQGMPATDELVFWLEELRHRRFESAT